MWFAQDEFHYVWKKLTGDISLAATVEFIGEGTEPHRKGCLMIRQSLDADSTYVDVVVHADGLTSLQFRDEKGGVTREVQTTVTNPRRLRIDKIGDSAYMLLSGADGKLATTGCSVRLPFSGEFHVGLGVCAHNANQVETVKFSYVEMTTPTTEAMNLSKHRTGVAMALRCTSTAAGESIAWLWRANRSRSSSTPVQISNATTTTDFRPTENCS
jgi:TolB protein